MNRLVTIICITIMAAENVAVCVQWDNPAVIHTDGSPGIYEITISGVITGSCYPMEV